MCDKVSMTPAYTANEVFAIVFFHFFFNPSIYIPCKQDYLGMWRSSVVSLHAAKKVSGSILGRGTFGKLFYSIEYNGELLCTIVHFQWGAIPYPHPQGADLPLSFL
jgi:hypothetical protein